MLLVVQLLTEEYSTMSPAALEAQGFISQKVSHLPQANSPDAQRKIACKDYS